jgi:hypothetical protein
MNTKRTLATASNCGPVSYVSYAPARELLKHFSARFEPLEESPEATSALEGARDHR